jgi:hypothetical protein
MDSQRQVKFIVLSANLEDPVDRKYLTIHLRGHDVRLQLDTGADVTLILRSTWNRIGRPAYKPSDVRIQTANGNPLKIFGQVECNFSYEDANHKGVCYVTEKLDLLGMSWIQKLRSFKDFLDAKCGKNVAMPHDIVSTSLATAGPNAKDEFIRELRQRFREVFASSLGRCTKAKASLQLKENVTPVYRPKRPVPYAAQECVDKELERLEENGVISRVNYSPWAAPIVVVKKANGTLRICADFSTGLNDALQSDSYPLPLPDDIFATLNGGKIFSQIDFADAYLQVEVEEDSKDLVTINTHRGLYRYNRLPFGVKSAPGIFQRIMDTMLAGLPGALAYLDDVIVVGKDEAEHRANLEAVFARIKDFGFRVRLEKCTFFMDKIRYLGVIIDKDGRRPDPKKIEAINRMPAPTDVASTRSFLGLLNFYGNFVAEMRELRAPLDRLLKKDTKWSWSKDCQSAFDRAKAILSSDLLLTHYNPRQDIIVSGDRDSGIWRLTIREQKRLEVLSRRSLPFQL